MSRSGKYANVVVVLVGVGWLAACSSDPPRASGSGGTGDTGGIGGTGGTPPHHNTGGPPASPTAANTYSWDGSWSPAASDFPIEGMVDADPGQEGLPPGRWGWDDGCSCASNEGTAIYDNEFVGKGLDFARLEDSEAHHFGWRLIDTDGGTTELDHRGDAFDGSLGVDIFGLDALASTGPGDDTPGINLGDGPDMLRFRTGQSVDMRTGATDRGALFDNDLVILGSEATLALNEYDIAGVTVHTGPGSDLVFARNFGPAGIDLGNGQSGRTDALDGADGDDLAVLAGNMRDFRIFGGVGDDVFVWYVDEVLDDRFLGPNFYGGGGWGEAVWGDGGIDRLILAVDPQTTVVHQRGEHDDNPGSLLAMVYSDYAPSIDDPTEQDVNARYYGLAEVGPNGEHTVTLSYRSPDGVVFTHDFYITAVEVIQLGTGNDAQTYRVNQSTGELTLDAGLEPMTALPLRHAFNGLFDTFGH